MVTGAQVDITTTFETISPEAVGFTPADDGWHKQVRGRDLLFRRIRSRADFEQCERLQRQVFGVSDYDLASFSIMVVIPKTGGEVLGAFENERMVGYIQGYGGYVNRQPRLISDLMAVEPAYRGGLGYALKTLQAVVALDAGFPEIVWTVDPLRAANARLNFERLGAYANQYIRDLYGSDFAQGLYRGMPSDRLVVTWPITSERVRSRLLGAYEPMSPDALDDLPDYLQDASSCVRLAVPSDIDALLATSPERAQQWRFQIRATLEDAFAKGYAIRGFAGSRDKPIGYYLLEKI